MKPKQRSKRRVPDQHCSRQPASAVLILFAKAPVPGQVKTRLCPPLSGDEAASLHGSIVMDALEQSRRLKEIDGVLAGAPSREHPFFQTVASRFGVHLWQQRGEDLGARMAHAFHTAFEQGYKQAVVVGTDIPEFSSEHCRQALNDLSCHDLVLGPTLDGGYFLIGMNRPTPDVFTDIPWSTPDVFAGTLRKARELGLSVGTISPLRDLDTLEDLQQFIQTVRGPAKSHISTRTAGVLHMLAKRLQHRPNQTRETLKE